MSVLARMKAHFTDLGVRSVEVPEWGEDGKPLVIYYSPMTVAESQKLQHAVERDGKIAALVDLLILKAMDSEGKKLFTIADKQAMRTQVDANVLSRVVLSISSTPSREDMGNGSSSNPASD